MALPGFLVMEMRAAFRSCAKQHRSSNIRYISSTSIRPKAPAPKPPPVGKSNPARSWPYNGAIAPQRPGSQPTSKSTDVIPQMEEPTALDTERRVPVPLRVIPKPEVGRNVRMTPRERLHIEVLTRQQPRRVEEKKIYRERIQIYHIGFAKENALAVLRVATLTCVLLVTVVFVPAHLKADTELWKVCLIGFGGFVPMFLINYAAGPMVTRIFLNLPTKARDTSKAAMEYAKNLPRDASLDIRYLKPWALEGKFQARVSDLEPATGNLVRPLSLKLKNYSRNDSDFFQPSALWVWPKTATGEKSKNTIPGLWDSMYKKLMRVPDGVEAARWKKT